MITNDYFPSPSSLFTSPKASDLNIKEVLIYFLISSFNFHTRFYSSVSVEGVEFLHSDVIEKTDPTI